MYDFPLYLGLLLIPYLLVGALLIAQVHPLVGTRFLRIFIIGFSACLVAFLIIMCNLLLLHHIIDTDYKNRIAADFTQKAVEKRMKIRQYAVGESPPLPDEQKLHNDMTYRYELLPLAGANVVNLIPILFF